MKVNLEGLDFQKNFEDVGVGETFMYDSYLYLKVKALPLYAEPLAINLETNAVEDLKWDDVCTPVKTKVILDK